jgi:hypothetical protein
MPRRFLHRPSLLRLARSKTLPWLVRALALLLVLGNAFAVAAPVQMLAMHHAQAANAGSAASADHTAAMQHHHHSATMAADVGSRVQAQHGSGCPCCDNGHCHCLQTCNPLPQIPVVLPWAPLLPAAAPAPMRHAGATSIVDAPPLRPPIA